jgi:hypothetical protein
MEDGTIIYVEEPKEYFAYEEQKHPYYGYADAITLGNTRTAAHPTGFRCPEE